jgi:hypothetical protein
MPGKDIEPQNSDQLLQKNGVFHLSFLLQVRFAQ